MHQTDQLFQLGPLESSRFSSVLLLDDAQGANSLNTIFDRLQQGTFYGGQN